MAGHASRATSPTGQAISAEEAYSVVEGRGAVAIETGGRQWRLEFGPRDHFVIPSWHTARFESQHGCVL
ncbi:MAG: gentisate 1,2-dioxygenase, partial [Burkholderiaceae bacterium]|nr:gentisate 1,2-dioxygenase [Burkholderiaceae bacterium]